MLRGWKYAVAVVAAETSIHLGQQMAHRNQIQGVSDCPQYEVNSALDHH